MKLLEDENSKKEVPRVVLRERRVLLADGRYLIYFDAAVVGPPRETSGDKG